MRAIRVLAWSGSLRRASLNTAMLQMAADCAPTGVQLTLYRGMGALPPFNPDLALSEPPGVTQLKAAIRQANVVLIASPEYAHGVSGVLKNALDWIVDSEVLVGKPVVLWNASPRASIALAALRETLTVMSAHLITQAELTLLIKPAPPDQASVNPDPQAMQQALEKLRQALTEPAPTTEYPA